MRDVIGSVLAAGAAVMLLYVALVDQSYLLSLHFASFVLLACFYGSYTVWRSGEFARVVAMALAVCGFVLGILLVYGNPLWLTAQPGFLLVPAATLAMVPVFVFAMRVKSLSQGVRAGAASVRSALVQLALRMRILELGFDPETRKKVFDELLRSATPTGAGVTIASSMQADGGVSEVHPDVLTPTSMYDPARWPKQLQPGPVVRAAKTLLILMAAGLAIVAAIWTYQRVNELLFGPPTLAESAAGPWHSVDNRRVLELAAGIKRIAFLTVFNEQHESTGCQGSWDTESDTVRVRIHVDSCDYQADLRLIGNGFLTPSLSSDSRLGDGWLRGTITIVDK